MCLGYHNRQVEGTVQREQDSRSIHLTLPGSTGLLLFLAVGNDSLLDVKDLNELTPGVKIEAEDGLVLLNALADGFTGLIWRRGIYSIVSMSCHEQG